MKKKILSTLFVLMLLSLLFFTLGTANSAPPYPIPTGPLSPPTIMMQAPTPDTTYVKWFVPLKFSVSGSWDGYLDHCNIAYSLDGGSKQTIYVTRFRFNTLAQDISVALGPLTEGLHQLQVFATVGGTYRTSTGTIVLGLNDATSQTSVYFSIDTANQAQIQILSPQNETYNVNQKIPVEFSVNHTDSILSMGFSLDNGSNVTVPRNTTTYGTLADGNHTLKVYSTFSDILPTFSTVNFTIDTTPPDVAILSLPDKKYNSSEIPLVFDVNESTSLITYILDEKVYTINGNTTMSVLQNGEHKLTVYATDKVGNVGASKTIDFDVVVSIPPDVALGVMPPLAVVLIGGLGLMIYLERRKQIATRKQQ